MSLDGSRFKLGCAILSHPLLVQGCCGVVFGAAIVEKPFKLTKLIKTQLAIDKLKPDILNRDAN